MSGTSAGATDLSPIRDLVSPEDLAACVELQEETWGSGFSERVPVAILGIAARLGGVLAGAFLPNGRLGGFVFGLTGIDDDGLAHWSDMLAVRPELRGSGLGRALKLHQRARLLERGIRRTFWTFDPLVARNAHLNFAKLGVVAREYVENMYGDSSSPLHQGIGTDRLVVLWEMASERVRSRLEEPLAPPPPPSSPPEAPRARSVLPEGTPSSPGDPVLDLDDPVLAVPVPTDIQQLKADDPEAARRWRAATRAVFTHYLARGWEVREFDRSAAPPWYILERVF